MCLTCLTSEIPRQIEEGWGEFLQLKNTISNLLGLKSRPMLVYLWLKISKILEILCKKWLILRVSSA